MKAELKEITENNKEECMLLRVSPGQSQYISDNSDSLREARENPEVARPFAIYVDGEMVGFTMFAFDEINDDPDRYWLWRLMIGERYQGSGYGKAALEVIIDYFRQQGADAITLSTKESNTAALGLYHKFGFKENGEMNGEEIVLKKPL